MGGISKIRYNVDKFFISPNGAPIYAIVDEEPTHIHLAKRIIDTDKTLTEIFNQVSEDLGKIDVISFLIANGYIYMDATQIGIDDEVFIIMYNPDSIEGMPNEKRLDNYIKTSNCTVYKYNELMEDGELFERLVSKVIEEKERIRIETEISKEVQEK